MGIVNELELSNTRGNGRFRDVNTSRISGAALRKNRDRSMGFIGCTWFPTIDEKGRNCEDWVPLAVDKAGRSLVEVGSKDRYWQREAF